MSNSKMIESFLNHNDPIARRQVIEDMTTDDLKDLSLISILIKTLEDNDIGVKDSAARLLSTVTGEPAIKINKLLLPNIESSNIELRNLSGEILKNTGRYSPELFIEYFKAEDFRIRQFAVDIVSEMKIDILKPHLLELLNDSNENVRSSAIDALGNYNDPELLSIFIERYDFENDLKPNLIEAIGKIQNKKSEEFVTGTFINSEDIFTKITCLDSLSQFSTNITLADDLYSQIMTYPESIHTVLLKTVYSIFERAKIKRTINDNLIPICIKALDEDDDEINYYGLLALGNVYKSDYIEDLIYLVFRDNHKTQKMVFENLILHNDASIIADFFNKYFENLHKSGCEINLLSYIPLLMIEHSDNKEKLNQFQKIILEIIIKQVINIDSSIMDMIESIDNEYFNIQITTAINDTYIST